MRFRRTFLFPFLEPRDAVTQTPHPVLLHRRRASALPRQAPDRTSPEVMGRCVWGCVVPIGIPDESALLWSGCSGEFDRKEQKYGAVAQLVAHLHGMQGVRGSSPLSSTDTPEKGTITT